MTTSTRRDLRDLTRQVGHLCGMIAFLLLTSAVQGQGKTHPEELQLQESIDKANAKRDQVR